MWRAAAGTSTTASASMPASTDSVTHAAIANEYTRESEENFMAGTGWLFEDLVCLQCRHWRRAAPVRCDERALRDHEPRPAAMSGWARGATGGRRASGVRALS